MVLLVLVFTSNFVLKWVITIACVCACALSLCRWSKPADTLIFCLKKKRVFLQVIYLDKVFQREVEWRDNITRSENP